MASLSSCSHSPCSTSMVTDEEDCEETYEAKLIKEVSKHPPLFDPACKGYRDADRKEIIWNGIAETVDQPGV